MNDCCHTPHQPHDPTMRQALQKAFAVNALMFVVELGAAFYAKSIAVLADSMDFFSDATAFGLGLYALNRSKHFRARFALVNAGLMVSLGLGVMVEAVSRLQHPVTPNAALMGGVGATALIANLLSAWWLYQHRTGDSLQQSFWLCSRNDALNNIAVILASLAVYFTQSHWPDMLVALLLMTLEIQSAYKVARQAMQELATGS
jgi:cation diffusion facilitator family transporter